MTISVVFFGTPEFSVPTLRALLSLPEVAVRLVVTQPDRLGGRDKQLLPPPVKLIAKEHGIPVLQPEHIKRQTPEFMESLHQAGSFDIGVVIAFGQILPLPVLSYPRVGCVNLHASLLPRWRGAAPIQRSIMAGDTESGVCLMQMEAGLDTGPVYAWQKVALSNDTTGGSLHDTLSEVSGALLKEHLADLVSGRLTPIPQSELTLTDSSPTYAAKIEGDDCAIDWRLSPVEIERQIRALAPYPGAFCYLRGKRLKITKAEVLYKVLPDTLNDQEPKTESELPAGSMEARRSAHGVIIRNSARELLVEVKNVPAGGAAYSETVETKPNSVGYLSLLELQAEGKRRMPAAEYLRGVQLHAGELLTSEP